MTRLVAVLVLLAAPAFANEVKRCELAPWPVPALASYAPTPISGTLKPRLLNGLVVDWGTSGAKLGIVWAGMSNALNMSSGVIGTLKAGFGNATGKGKQIVYASAASSGSATRQWADPTDEAWDHAAQAIAQAGLTPQQVVVWMMPHTVTEWASEGLMTAAMVSQVMAHVKARYPNVALFLMTDLTPMPWAHAEDKWGNPEPGGVSVDGIPYPAGMLTKHPSPISIAADGYVLAQIAETQEGVPMGTIAEYFPLRPEIDCERDHKEDGVHYTGTGQGGGGVYVGSYFGSAAYAWLRRVMPWAQ